MTHIPLEDTLPKDFFGSEIVSLREGTTEEEHEQGSSLIFLEYRPIAGRPAKMLRFRCSEGTYLVEIIGETATVHYKDIDFEEVLKCTSYSDTPSNRLRWEAMRGKLVQIKLPMVSEAVRKVQFKTFTCGGPFYYRSNENPMDAVCEHLIDWGKK